MQIIDILLQKVYHSSLCLQRSIILVKKGMLLRTSGIEGLDNCIHCLSEAIESAVSNIRLSFHLSPSLIMLIFVSLSEVIYFCTWITLFYRMAHVA